MLFDLLQLTRRSLWLTCYRTDLVSGAAVLADLLGKGIEVRLLLCEFVHHDPPKCLDTQHALWVLFGAPGAERLRVRFVRQAHGVFPTLHSKT